MAALQRQRSQHTFIMQQFINTRNIGRTIIKIIRIYEGFYNRR